MLFVKNRGKNTVEDLEGGNGKVHHDGQVHHDAQDNVPPVAQSTPSEIIHQGTKETSEKPKEAQNKPFDRQATITRLAVLNTATEIIKTWGKPVEFSTVISLASQLEKWALGD